VRLASTTGAVVELSPRSYEFGPSSEPEDWDANWLVIAGHVALPDGRSWSFNDPCLTTWEARELGSWLESVAAGDVEPFDFSGGEDARLLMFTEPVVGFSLASRVGASVTLRVHFSLESEPPWRADELDDDDTELFDYFVELKLTTGSVAEAAAAWDAELAAFPVR
jgi:hypothetical protein